MERALDRRVLGADDRPGGPARSRPVWSRLNGVRGPTLPIEGQRWYLRSPSLVASSAGVRPLAAREADRVKQPGPAGTRCRPGWLGGRWRLGPRGYPGDDLLGHPVEQRQRAGDHAAGLVDVLHTRTD